MSGMSVSQCEWVWALPDCEPRAEACRPHHRRECAPLAWLYVHRMHVRHSV